MERKKRVRVLIISHNAFSETNNLGKTLLNYFRDFSSEELAQFYIQDNYPENIGICNNYYRFTDRDALKSLFGINTRHSFKTSDLKNVTAVNHDPAIESIRQYGRRRNVLVYFLRNIIWRLANWNTEELYEWLNAFDPDVILFMSGDYKFMYKITLTIQKVLNKPLVVWCGDDHYIYNRNESSFFGRLQHKHFFKTVKKVMEKASCLFTVSDLMRDDYQKLFNKTCFTLHTGAEERKISAADNNGKIAYFGNLGYKRGESLLDIGRALRSLGLKGSEEINVYSGEKNPDNLKGFTSENGIKFHGEISSSEVADRMAECIMIIHAESFDNKIQKMIKYSVSTKIADSLLNGPCLLAYGPEGLASIDYLKKNKAAFVITRQEDLKAGLREILTNAPLRSEIISNARNLAKMNHDAAVTTENVRKWLKMAIDRTVESNCAAGIETYENTADQ